MSNNQIVIEKAKNFKAYLLQYNPSQMVRDQLETYYEDTVVDSIKSTLLPMVRAGFTESMVNQFIEQLQVNEDDVPSVKNKITRYLNMFDDLLG